MFSKIFLAESDTTIDPERDALGGYEVKNQCVGCKWFDAKAGTSCQSFPEGIPLVILLGEYDHTVPYDPDDDEELVFTPK